MSPDVESPDLESAAPEQVGWFTTPDGLTLRVSEGGGGPEPTLVLVHGWSQDLRTWDRVVADLRAAGLTGRILRYDHRGHGASDPPPRERATIGRAADDLAALIAERVPDGPVVLGGHSMGGMTIMALAERHPDLVARRVAGAAFVATASADMEAMTLGLPGRRGQLVARGERVIMPWAAKLGRRARVDGPSGRARALGPGTRFLVFGRHARRADVLAVAEQALAAHPPSVAAFRRSIAEHRRTGTLAALRGVPTVVAVGDRDRLTPQHHARVIARELPDAEIVLYPGAGHMINYERSAEVAAHLRGLLDAARPAVAAAVDPNREPLHAAV